MKRATQLLLTLGLAVVVTACGERPADQTAPPPASGGAATPSTPPVGTSGTASAADREFVDAQVTMTRKEAGLARLAQERATNAQVKELASRVAMESQRAGEQLEQLAGKSGMQLTTAEGEQLREERDRLSKLAGREFDREYVTEVIADLERVVRDLEAKADSGNADLRDWASKAVAGWRTHLEEARRLKGTIGA